MRRKRRKPLRDERGRFRRRYTGLTGDEAYALSAIRLSASAVPTPISVAPNPDSV